MKPGLAIAAAGFVLLNGGVAAADISKTACIEANTSGQSLRLDQKLTAARAQFQLCSDAKCPDMVRVDCVQRLEEIDAASPTIVFDVKQADGSDAADVKVSIDGIPATQKIDGSPMKVDPGSHQLTFEIAGEAPIARTFVFKEGEKMRRERISFEKGTAGTPPPVAPPPATPAASSGGNGDILRYGGLGIGAVGVAALAVGVVFGLKAGSAYDDQQASCASPTDCKNHDAALKSHDDVTSFGTISTIGVVAGGALVIGGALLFVFAPHGASTSTTAAQWRNPFRFTF